MIGQSAMEEWIGEQNFGRGPGAAFFFWYSVDRSDMLPLTALDGLESCVRNAGFDARYRSGMDQDRRWIFS